MNDTLSTVDPAEQVAAVRRIIDRRRGLSCEPTLAEIRKVVEPPPVDTRPLAVDDQGWPYLNTEGTAWERHDDPSVTD